MLPTTLALVDDDTDFSEGLALHLREQGVQVTRFPDGEGLLVDPQAYGFGFYALDMTLPGIAGLELLKILRRRTQAGRVVVSAQPSSDVFQQVIDAGADMYLQKPAGLDQVTLAIKAVHRRIVTSSQENAGWQIKRSARQLKAPDGTRIDLSATDLAVLACFAVAEGRPVDRHTLCLALGIDNDTTGELLTATIYRLRRRIERATPLALPLQTRAGFGYVFNAPLKSV